jgi:peptide/nickel transport system substrate-binding protein
VDVEVLEGATFSEEWANKTQKEAVLIGLGDGLLDAAYSLGHYETGAPLNEGRTDYVNPEVNDRILEANSSMDQDLRERLYNEALAIVAEDRPHVFLYQQPAAYGVSDRVSFTPRLDDRMYFDDITLN